VSAGERDPPLEILLVEDNPGDARLTREAFREACIPCNLAVARDGIEALGRLRGEGEFAGTPLPHLVLLDLNMPRMDGREVLAALKSDPLLRAIPVVVLSSSEADQDVAAAYDLHANCYVAKPVDLEGFIAVVQAIQAFWFTVVKLPRGRLPETAT
jgi:two-component system, chemotaxis family, response regulator Rcp1